MDKKLSVEEIAGALWFPIYHTPQSISHAYAMAISASALMPVGDRMLMTTAIHQLMNAIANELSGGRLLASTDNADVLPHPPTELHIVV